MLDTKISALGLNIFTYLSKLISKVVSRFYDFNKKNKIMGIKSSVPTSVSFSGVFLIVLAVFNSKFKPLFRDKNVP